MKQKRMTQLLNRIEIGKKQLVEITMECQSLVHQKVLKKSQELDDLISQYHMLINS